MTHEHTAAIAFDEFRDPVVAYVVDDEPRITTTNDAFERRFDGISTDSPVEPIFERFSVVDSTGDEDPVTHLVRGDGVGIYLDGGGETGPLFARVLPSGDDAGYLLFSDLRACPDVADPPVDQVSSVISHDLRNPLDVAKAHLRAARETGDPEHFDAVSDAHDRMEQIIRDVLTLTRGQTAVDPSERVSIETAAVDAWQSVDTERATLDVRETLPTVTADPDRVRRLFENVFRNSVEHGSGGGDRCSGDGDRSGAGGPETNPESEVTITVGALEDGFYVSDDGSGIPSEARDEVFEPGYSTREDGTGLGLAIVDRIVDAHDWHLTLTTATNGGARFEIRF
ncbi:sensor histidine kinase [Halorubrum sp. CBA1125]|uniref:sensor histidine kinase n=1 Tax=Halorubrum sp. CBA1125 TaxID=2668072 RepID=UPI0012E98AB8|nr:HAMP domain-containing sensor histidine kinase [Halorubrum sp. CBA1125]MUW14352.1 sensor histidine kinase [Halorubrum sp. CBA1125]